MSRIYGYYEWDDSVGSPGHRDDGSLHQNLYNEDRVLAGHARFVPDDGKRDEDDEYSYENTFITTDRRRESEGVDELAEAIVVLLSVLVTVGIAKGAPHVKKWWQERAHPAVRRQAQKIRNLLREKQRSTEELEPAEDELAAVEIERRQVMSREEAMSRLIAALAARAYSDDQLRIVTSAHIVGLADYSQIEESIARIPPEQLHALVLEMAMNPSLLEDESLANLASELKTEQQSLKVLLEPVTRMGPNSSLSS